MVKSWDCFDTLIARKYVHPHSVWQAVGDRLGVTGYATLRRRAEIEEPATLEGACKILSRQLKIATQDLMEAEIAAELEHCFPIIENLQQVQAGDLVVSDMYLPQAVIHRILAKCGLTVPVELVVTNGGKAQGWIWRQLPEFELHTGDNLHSDITTAKAAGRMACYYNGHLLTPQEEELAEYHPNLAYWSRFGRLQCPYPSGTPEWRLWNEQCSLNLPLLVLSSLCLHQRYGHRPIAFALRDSIHWQPLYQALFPEARTVLFWASRRLYAEGSRGYQNYLCHLLGEDLPRWVIADLQGTGNSARRFFSRYLKAAMAQFFVCSSESLAVVPSGYISDGTVNWDAIERFSCPPFGSALAWDDSLDSPQLASSEHPLAYVQAQQSAMELLIANAASFPVPYLTGEAEQLARRLCEQMADSATVALMPHLVEH